MWIRVSCILSTVSWDCCQLSENKLFVVQCLLMLRCITSFCRSVSSFVFNFMLVHIFIYVCFNLKMFVLLFFFAILHFVHCCALARNIFKTFPFISVCAFIQNTFFTAPIDLFISYLCLFVQFSYQVCLVFKLDLHNHYSVPDVLVIWVSSL